MAGNQSDMGNMLKGLLSNPQAAKALGDIDKYKKLMDTPEGKAVLAQLGGSGGDSLKNAAQKGDTASAMKLVSSLLSTPEGAKLAGSIMNMVKK